MPEPGDVIRVVDAARRLDVPERGDRWCHLPLCVLDAVFSIGARYSSTVRATRAYARFAGLEPVTAPADAVAAGRHATTEEGLGGFLSRVRGLSDEELADVVRNRQQTSTKNGVLKATAARRYAETLHHHGVDRLADVSTLLADAGRTAAVEEALATIPGHGSGVRVSYLWMLCGDDTHVKVDRMVLRWLRTTLGRELSVGAATDLMTAGAHQLGVTPWRLDHAIWLTQRARRT